MSFTSDRNLLFGILAVHLDFVSQEALFSAMHAWLADKSKTLGELLVERGDLSPGNRDLLEPLVDAHVAQHGGDVQQSLAALSSDGGMLAGLAQVDDADVQASLSLLPQSVPLPVEAGFPSSAQSADRVAEDVAADPRFQETRLPGTLDQIDQPQLRFRILRPHAEGGLGRVSVALDSELHREVAFKEIKFEHARRQDAQTRFLVEAEITGGLEHPGIVPVYGLGHFADGRPFYAMRFIRGQSLHDAVRAFYSDGSFDPQPQAQALPGESSQPGNTPDRAPTNTHASGLRSNDGAGNKHAEARLPYASNLEFRGLINRLIDVCNAMHYAHDRKVLHRDLKPGNIMLGKYGETLVVDWGLAKATGKDHPLARSTDGELPVVPASGSQSAPTQMGSAIGTPAYMPPEQAEGKLDQLGPASDVYSLGATLYEILTGEPPLKGRKIPEILKRVCAGAIPRPQTINPDVPLPLQAVCRKAMALRPADRYPSAKALAADLEAWLADEPVSAFREPLVARSRRWMRRHPALVSSTAAAVLMAVAGLSVLSTVVTGKNQQLADANQRETRARQTAETNERRAVAGEQLAKANEQRAVAGETLARQNEARALAGEELAKQNEARAVAGEQLAKQNEARAVTGEELARKNAEAATAQSALALSAMNSVIFDIQRSLENVAGGATVRNRLLSSVLPQLEQVSTEFASKSAIDRNTMVALNELADTVLQLGGDSPARAAGETADALPLPLGERAGVA